MIDDKAYSDLNRAVHAVFDRHFLKRTCQDLADEFPDEWREACPRRVVSPPNYLRHEFQSMMAVVSTNDLRRSIANRFSKDGTGQQPSGLCVNVAKGPTGALQAQVEFEVDALGKGSVPFSTPGGGGLLADKRSNAASAARCMALILGKAFKWPTYYFTEDLARALLMTAPPENLKIADVKWPLDFFSIFLPVTAEMKQLTCGRRVPCIWVGKWHAGGSYQLSGSADREAFVVSFTCFEELEPGKGEIMVDYGAVLDTSGQVSAIHTVKKDFSIGDNASDSEDFLAKMIYLAISAAMAMTSRPALVEAGTLQRPEKRSKRGTLEVEALWSPNLVGRQYRHGPPQGGTHASPRAHWRCGHWRRQHYGPRPWTDDTKFELIWIEPVMVAADAAGT